MTIHQMPKLKSVPQKATKTTVDTIEITPILIKGWKHPPFQRPLKENEKVRMLAEQIKVDGVLPGVITLGILEGDTYIVDGQHRCHGYILSGLPSVYADVRTHYFDTFAEMGEEFVRLNSSLVKLRPDDILRGLEASLPTLQRLRKKCPFVGYDMIRRNEKAPILSMSMVLRQWYASFQESPSSAPISSTQIAQTSLTESEVDTLIAFLTICYDAWGRDMEYARLWASLNLGLCMWLFRRLVLGHDVSAVSTRLTHDQFRKCLMALSADSKYLDYLVGRKFNERDRSPAYQRIKARFAGRLYQETGKKPKLPNPPWVGHIVRAGAGL